MIILTKPLRSIGKAEILDAVPDYASGDVASALVLHSGIAAALLLKLAIQQ